MAGGNIPSDAEEQGAWARPVSSRRGEIVVALALLATAAFFVWHSSFLPLGGVKLPGPGFFPLVLGVILGVLALAILFLAVRGTAGETVYLGHRNVLVVLAALAGVAFAFEGVDTYVLLAVFMAVILLFVARASFGKVLLAALVTIVLIWAAFTLALGVRLPAGEFWNALRGLAAAKSHGQ